jgi:hypothetical protein
MQQIFPPYFPKLAATTKTCFPPKGKCNTEMNGLSPKKLAAERTHGLAAKGSTSNTRDTGQHRIHVHLAAQNSSLVCGVI